MKTYDEIAYNVLSRRDEYEKEKKLKRKRAVAVSSAIGCFVIAVIFGTGLSRQEKIGMGLRVTESSALNFTALTETTVPTTQQDILTATPATTFETTTSAMEIYYELSWEEKSMPGKYRAFVSEGREYVYPFNEAQEHPISRKGTKIISDKTIEWTEPDGTKHSTVADIFSLEGFDEKLALGVKFPDDERIYPYVYTQYLPNTLGEFLEAVDFYNSVTYGDMYFFCGEPLAVSEKNAEDIKNYLLSDVSLVNIQDIAVTGLCVTASISCAELGFENKCFSICEDGYIATNLIGYEYVFYVGKEKVADFLKESYNLTFEETIAVTMNTTVPVVEVAPTTQPAYSGALPQKESEAVVIATTGEAVSE